MATLAQTDFALDMVLTGIPLPITLRPHVPLSDEELMRFSRRNRLYRIEQNAKGEIEIMTPVGSKGSRWESRVIREVDLWAEQHGGASFSSSGGFRLPDGSVLSADAAFVAAARWNALTNAEQTTFAPLCPDFVIEILSHSDSRRTLEAKMQTWIDNGAKLAWMIDPYAATVSVYRPGAEIEILERPASVEAGEPVAGFRLSTAVLWELVDV
jgi:Uma2 family endonuclease